MNKASEQHAKHELQAACFTLHEIVLYLDTHPDCRKAMQMYRNARKKYLDLYAQYETQYGPLTANGVTGDHWTWGEQAWPWHGGNDHVDV